MRNLKVSIIIPVFKVEQYLRDCVDSVLTQSYKNLEIILVDDGSPDNCPAICDEYATLDTRIRVVHKTNGGLSDARNVGLKTATGDYVVFLDSDDYYAHTDFLETLVEASGGGKQDAIFFQRTVFFDNTERPNKPSIPFLLEWNALDTGSLLLELAKHDQLDASACMKATKRSILQENNLYFRTGMYSEDIEWFSRYIQYVHSIVLVNKPDYYYRKRVGSITASHTEKSVYDLFYTIQTHSDAIRDSELEDKRTRAILSYHSYQYYIVLGLANNHMKGDARRQLLDKCVSYKWLTKFSNSHKTKRSALVLRLLGVKLASIVFGYYIKHK